MSGSGEKLNSDAALSAIGERGLFAGTFDVHIGTEWLDLGSDEARARIAVEDHHKQPFGLVHGGVLASLAESICSVATQVAVADDGMIALGQSNDTTFLRPISGGHVNASARPRHRGRTTWIWDVDIRDDDERVCALVRILIAVRPRGGAPNEESGQAQLDEAVGFRDRRRAQ